MNASAYASNMPYELWYKALKTQLSSGLTVYSIVIAGNQPLIDGISSLAAQAALTKCWPILEAYRRGTVDTLFNQWLGEIGSRATLVERVEGISLNADDLKAHTAREIYQKAFMEWDALGDWITEPLAAHQIDIPMGENPAWQLAAYVRGHDALDTLRAVLENLAGKPLSELADYSQDERRADR